MPSDMIFHDIAGFRLVTAAPDLLSAFYGAIGFDVGAPGRISKAELELLGLTGSGMRIPMSLGACRVDLDSFDQPGRPYPVDARACDLVFQHFALVTDDAAVAWRRALDAGARPISRDGPVTLPRFAGGVTAVKFRDPEGHPLELLQFPPASDSNWSGTGIIGIDHSAIAVSAIAASRHFYARHGLRETGATLNEGPTQDRLDGLDDVRVDVVPMKPRRTPPHLELLGYRHPIGRRPRALAPNDIAATRVVWRSDDVAILHDPDGHLHQLSR